MTIEYLTIEKFLAQGNGAAINQDSNTGWTLRYDTLTLNAPGAGMIAGADNTLEHNCLTLNGQYGFQSSDVDSWGHDALTGGPYDVTIEDNEISYNDTCDFEGRLTNSAIGWSNYNPVPMRYRNAHCGQVTPDGDEGGFKLWETDGVTIKDNYIHNNWGRVSGRTPTTLTRRTPATRSPTTTTMRSSRRSPTTSRSPATTWPTTAGWAGWATKVPHPAIYVSQSGSDRTFGGVPPARKPHARTRPLPGRVDHQREYVRQQRRERVPVAELGPLLLGRLRQRLHAGRRGQLEAVHDGRLQGPTAVHLGQHDHVRKPAHRDPGPGLVERLPGGPRTS